MKGYEETCVLMKQSNKNDETLKRSMELKLKFENIELHILFLLGIAIKGVYVFYVSRFTNDLSWDYSKSQKMLSNIFACCNKNFMQTKLKFLDLTRK